MLVAVQRSASRLATLAAGYLMAVHITVPSCESEPLEPISMLGLPGSGSFEFFGCRNSASSISILDIVHVGFGFGCHQISIFV